MKKYLVVFFINSESIIGWGFKTLEQAKYYFDERVRTISIDRKNKNRQSIIKFKDNDWWGYMLIIEDVDTNKYKTIESNCMSWKEAKEAK